MSKWKCEICNKEFDNFHAQGFDNKIHCPLCFFKEKSKRLEQENTQLKSVIKEIREYIKKNKLYNYKYDEEELFEIITDEVAKEDLLKMLDKGEKNDFKGS